MAQSKIKLTKEDRDRFSKEIKTATPDELLIVKSFVEEYKDRFYPEDLKFLHSHLGQRATKLLRNVAKNLSWED